MMDAAWINGFTPRFISALVPAARENSPKETAAPDHAANLSQTHYAKVASLWCVWRIGSSPCRPIMLACSCRIGRAIKIKQGPKALIPNAQPISGRLFAACDDAQSAQSGQEQQASRRQGNDCRRDQVLAKVAVLALGRLQESQFVRGCRRVI